jgi:hypothetical protein
LGLLFISSSLVPTAGPSLVGTAFAGESGCTDPPGAPGEPRLNPETGDIELCEDVSDPRTNVPDFQWVPMRPSVAPQWQEAYCYASWTVTVPAASQPLTLVMAFGDGASETRTVPPGTRPITFTFTHEFDIGSLWSTLTQRATVQESGLYDEAETWHGSTTNQPLGNRNRSRGPVVTEVAAPGPVGLGAWR